MDYPEKIHGDFNIKIKGRFVIISSHRVSMQVSTLNTKNIKKPLLLINY